jgi:hypothetical protein
MSSLFIPLVAQDKEAKVVKQLEEKDQKKVAKADKLLAKGYEILKEAEQLEAEITQLQEADGRIKTRKINKLEKKSNDIKIKASVYLEDGYSKKIKTYESALKDIRKADPQRESIVQGIEDEAAEQEKKARRFYRKSDNMASPDKMVELIELGQEKYLEVIEIQLAGLLTLWGETGSTEPVQEVLEEPAIAVQEMPVEQDTLVQDSVLVVESPVAELDAGTTASAPLTTNPSGAALAAAGVAGTAAIVAGAEGETAGQEETPLVAVVEEPTQEEVLQTDVKDEPVESSAASSNEDVFFTVQFMADKNPASQERIAQMYQGSEEVVEMKGDGWYRYSIGKCTVLEDAKELMKKEGVKGFIVAYHNGQRITIREAIERLK